MTSDDIKNSVTMVEVLSRYGHRPNRRGFMCCPFHLEDTPSMKIYKDSFYCYGCGKSGDIFTWVMFEENCGFKEAFLILGGEYDISDLDGERRKKELQRLEEQKRRELEEQERTAAIVRNQQYDYLTMVYTELIEKAKPYSEAWVDAVIGLQRNLARCEEEYLNGTRFDAVPTVHDILKRIKSRNK